jgi:hypothetical protein
MLGRPEESTIHLGEDLSFSNSEEGTGNSSHGVYQETKTKRPSIQLSHRCRRPKDCDWHKKTEYAQWERIKRKSSITRKVNSIFDLTTRSHNFFANGILIHNSVTVNHEVFQTVRKAGMNIFWFNPIFDDWRQNESWTKLQVLMSTTDKYIRGVPRMSAGGNAGACAWIAALTLFHRSPIALIGIDFGYPKGTPLEQTQ